jgi:hypothetical protein
MDDTYIYTNQTSKVQSTRLKMKRSFIIYGPPRTGATLVRYNIEKFLKFFSGAPKHTHNVIQTHDPKFRAPHEDCTCLITHRHNVFDSICSQLVAQKTNEYTEYSDKSIEPFTVDVADFIKFHNSFETFYDQIDRTQYKKIIDIWYEDLVNDPYYLFEQFNIVEKTNYNEGEGSTKSPYNYYNLIINIDELRDFAHQRGLFDK